MPENTRGTVISTAAVIMDLMRSGRSETLLSLLAERKAA